MARTGIVHINLYQQGAYKMYFRTIAEFLEDIENFKEFFGKWCYTNESWFRNKEIKLNVEDFTITETKDSKKTIIKKDKDSNKRIIQMEKDIAQKFIESKHKETIIDELRKYAKYTKGDEGKGETASWIFSLPALAKILKKSGEECEKFLSAEIALEAKYFTGKTPDVTIIGKNNEDKTVVVLIENKRWSNLDECKPKGKRKVEVPNFGIKLHPCIQVNNYRECLKYFNSYIQKNDIEVSTAVYMQNGEEPNCEEGLFNKECFENVIDENPIFVGKNGKNVKDGKTLSEYLVSKITYGVGGLAKQIYKSEVEYSQEYLKIIKETLENQRFIENQVKLFQTLADEKQSSIFDTIKESIKNKTKKVFIIKGTPGTGKTFLGLSLLASIYDEIEDSDNKPTCLYITKSKTQRLALLERGINLKIIFYAPPNDKLGGDEESGGDEKPNRKLKDEVEVKYDCIICDDSQRYSQFFVDGREAIKTIIDQSTVSVFFYDEKQIVHVEDSNVEDGICKYKEDLKDTIEVIELEEIYRTKIPKFWDISFMNIIDVILEKSKHEIVNFERLGGYEVALACSESELFSRIIGKKMRKICGNSDVSGVVAVSRVVAGKGHNKKNNSDWCWNKYGKIGPFRERGSLFESNIYSEESRRMFITDDTDDKGVKLIGNIDVSYGLDFEYIGVIIAPDLKFSKSSKTVEVCLNGHQHQDAGIIGYLNDDEKKKKQKEKEIIIETKFNSAIKRFQAEQESKKKPTTIEAEQESKEKPITIEDIIKNTYRVLLTRGEKGCYIYCCNEKLQNYLEQDLHIPLMKRGRITMVELDKENRQIIKAKIEEISYKNRVENKEYEVSQETVKDMYEKRGEGVVKEILEKNKIVTFIEHVEKDGKKYAESIELDVKK